MRALATASINARSTMERCASFPQTIAGGCARLSAASQAIYAGYCNNATLAMHKGLASQVEPMQNHKHDDARLAQPLRLILFVQAA